MKGFVYMNFIKKLFTAALFIGSVLTLSGIAVSAEHYNIEGFEIPIDVVINGSIIKTPVNSFLETENDTVYVPIRAISETMGAVVTWTDETKTATVSKDENSIDFSIYDEENTAVIYLDTMFIPVRAVSEKLGYDVRWDDYYYQVWISAPDVTVDAERIDATYTNPDILIVAQVLQCECGPGFEGKIAVANVISNRAKSDLFPDTVQEVIYDRRYGSVQFTIAYNGKLDNTPSKENILAAKCSLDGVTVAPDCLFYQADFVKNSWMDKNRERAVSIGGNTFFY
ncbi:MAG: hypothetical protein E7621_01835 [Ruminococcaceae bacterium]|nr:hypothetical protein [Oscillospiraceae bacterium]